MEDEKGKTRGNFDVTGYFPSLFVCVRRLGFYMLLLWAWIGSGNRVIMFEARGDLRGSSPNMIGMGNKVRR